MTIVLALLAKVASSSLVHSDSVEISAHGLLSSGEHKRYQVMRKEERSADSERSPHIQALSVIGSTNSSAGGTNDSSYTSERAGAANNSTDSSDGDGDGDGDVDGNSDGDADGDADGGDGDGDVNTTSNTGTNDSTATGTNASDSSSSNSSDSDAASTGNATHHADGTLKATTNAGNATHHHHGALKDTSTHAPNGSASDSSASAGNEDPEKKPTDKMCSLNNPGTTDPANTPCTTTAECSEAMIDNLGSDYSNTLGSRMRQCCCELKPAGDDSCWVCGCQQTCDAPHCSSDEPLSSCVGR